MPQDDSAIPSWKELAEFLKQQGKDDRELVDAWFKRAIKLLWAVLGLLGLGAVFFGISTYHDIHVIAERTATMAVSESATNEIKRLMQEPRIQQVVNQTAAQLFKEGAYKKAIQDEVRGEVEAAIRSQLFGQYDVSVNGVQHQTLKIEKKIGK